GLPRATVHLYNAISPLFREVVFKNSKQATVDLAVTGAQQIIATAEKRLSEETIFGFEYSPEIFVDAEIDFALEICNAVT
ncbi:2-isopropylmalate synthase, partial [Aerococcus urinae]|nr:2-isopropylmalate synthase [Aerococcus urinae]